MMSDQKSAIQPDIDTQIEDKLDTELRRLQAHAITLGYYIDHPDQEKYREQAHKAIKTLLDTAVQEARIDGLVDASWMVAHMSRKDAHKAILDRTKQLKSTSKEDK